MVAVVWGGKDVFSKQTQMGFCLEDPQTDSRDGGAWHTRSPELGAPKDREADSFPGGGARDDPLT